MKNLQFLFNFDETSPKGPINELVNWSKFGKYWTKIVGFSLIVNSDASLILYESVSSLFKSHISQFKSHICQFKFHISQFKSHITSVRPKPKFRPKLRSKSAETVRPKLR